MLGKFFSRKKQEGSEVLSAETEESKNAPESPAAEGSKRSFNAKSLLRKHWPVIAILIIIVLSFHIRLVGFYTPDGDPKWPYLRNIDSYFFLRETEDIVNNGGMLPPHDDLMLVPEGRTRSPSFYTVLSASAYGLIGQPMGMSIPDFMVWFPVLLTSLIAIPGYYIGRSLYDRKAGIFTALFFTLSPTIMARTLGGDPDSDAIVMLMMATSIAAYLVLYKKMDRDKIFSRRNILLAGIAGLGMALFAHSWGGYWFALWIIVAFIISKTGIEILLSRGRKEQFTAALKEAKPIILTFLMMLLAFYLFTVPFKGIDFIGDPPRAVFGSLGLSSGLKAETGIFPNVHVSIAELQVGGDARQVAIRSAGVDTAASVSRLPLEGLLLLSPFILSLASLAYLGYSYVKRREHLDTFLFLGIWLAGMLYASIVAVRFGIFIAPVYAIASSIILAKIWRLVLGEDRVVSA